MGKPSSQTTSNHGHTETATRTALKRARGGNQSKLKDNGKVVRSLIDMPLEIFTEISCYVSPGDLISLARTCKTFRSILMQRSAEKIWSCAEDNATGYPSYPWSNLTKPQFAALVFTRYCSSCGGNTSSNADPFLLVRLCSAYRETQLTAIDYRSHCSLEARKLIMKTDLIHFKKKNARPQVRGAGSVEYSLTKEFESVNNMFNFLSQPGSRAVFQRWEKETKEIKMRREFGKKLQTYFSATEIIRSRELADLKQQRMTDVKERLRTLGRSNNELELEHSGRRDFLASVEQPRPLTDRTCLHESAPLRAWAWVLSVLILHTWTL